MSQDLPTPDLTPEQQLLSEIETDRIIADRPETPPLSPEAIAKAREEVQQLLTSQGILPPADQKLTPSTVAFENFSQNLVIDPVATLAAADTVKSIIQWKAGVIRLLQSPMRGDLAVEVVVDEKRQEEFFSGVFFVSVGANSPSVAAFSGESPVFCRVHAEDLIHGAPLTIEWIPTENVDAEHLVTIRESLSNLRDPGSLERYEEFLRQAEGP